MVYFAKQAEQLPAQPQLCADLTIRGSRKSGTACRSSSTAGQLEVAYRAEADSHPCPIADTLSRTLRASASRQNCVRGWKGHSRTVSRRAEAERRGERYRNRQAHVSSWVLTRHAHDPSSTMPKAMVFAHVRCWRLVPVQALDQQSYCYRQCLRAPPSCLARLEDLN